MHHQQPTVLRPAATALLAVLLLSAAGFSRGDVTDVFKPFCGPESYKDPPPKGWKRWSDPRAWPNSRVPGVGNNRGANATIPCGVGILLDVSITVYVLKVNGWLKVEAAGPLQVLTAFVLNQGRVTVGTADAPYRGKLTVNLTGAANELTITRPPAAPYQPRSVGVRVFATVGGRLELNGMYGNAPAWTTLAATANKGARAIRVKGDVSAWPVGGVIAIASTDFDRYQAENFTITSVARGARNTTVLGLGGALAWMHWGEAVAAGAAGLAVDEAAEVALLSRAIVIQGHQNPDDPLIGGHLIVMQTAERQLIKGVELVNMGQQGNLGRYPMHFHLCQNVRGSVVSSCSVHDSNQRCYVVHGTWNLRLEWNLGINTKGHCFLLEDGVETGNVFYKNLGFLQEPPQRMLTPLDAKPAIQSDNSPSTFWITNPANTFIGNVAAGSSDSGFWFQLEADVKGPSALYARAAAMAPKLTPLGLFVGNAAHSNGRAGLRTYPSGYRPRVNGGVSTQQEYSGINAPAANITFKGFRAYKNQFIGMFIHETDSLTITEAQVADNAIVGIELNRDQAITISNSVILGETDNTGNPLGCDNTHTEYTACKSRVEKTGSCDLPMSSSPDVARSNSPTVSRYWTQFGILIDQDEYPGHGRKGMPHKIVNCTFGKFYNKCRTSAAVTANGHGTDMWTTAHSSAGIRMVDRSPFLWMVPRQLGQLGFETGGGDAGPLTRFLTWKDEDGTVLGGRGGYAVANTTGLEPSSTAGCSPRPQWNGMACPSSCYRSVGIMGAPFLLTRIADGAVINPDGARYVNLPANTSYLVTFTALPSGPVSLAYTDQGLSCSSSVVLQLAPPAPRMLWQVASAPNLFWQACGGVQASFRNMTQLAYKCDAQRSVNLQVTLGSSSSVVVSLSAVRGSISCTLTQCGVFSSSAVWRFSDIGTRPASFLSLKPLAASDASWKRGVGPFGRGGQGELTTLASPQASCLAFYFRRQFKLKGTSLLCYQRLLLGVVASDGFVVYVNGNEVLRSNMPQGRILPTTPASMDASPNAPWSTFSVSLAAFPSLLRTGANQVAVELHTSSPYSWEARFDMWMALASNTCAPWRIFNPQSVIPTPQATPLAAARAARVASTMASTMRHAGGGLGEGGDGDYGDEADL
ncbi:hypothetical protein CLOM_g7684 [Closterium sp. NIES-68]|nr:hypothetical protein CLOM_g7684 [Closterium sp. NIES-68]GJP82556.1 hypothetical protein CLOP_g12799 [Closterium sp. NIES-67]